MSDLRKAAEAALEALQGVLDTYGEPLDLLSISGGAYEALQCRDAITALRAALAEPMQEPVAWLAPDGSVRKTTGAKSFREWKWGANDFKPLYTAPPQRKPLTEEEIKECERQAMVNGALPFEQRVFFARAIERAHGITE